jgi:hypothetical protein
MIKIAAQSARWLWRLVGLFLLHRIALTKNQNINANANVDTARSALTKRFAPKPILPSWGVKYAPPHHCLIFFSLIPPATFATNAALTKNSPNATVLSLHAKGPNLTLAKPTATPATPAQSKGTNRRLGIISFAQRLRSATGQQARWL